MEWVEERKIHQLKALEQKHPDVDWARPPCSVCTVDDASKQPQQVVLTEMPGSEPVLRVYCKTEVQTDEHFLSPDTMLRAGQGTNSFASSSRAWCSWCRSRSAAQRASWSRSCKTARAGEEEEKEDALDWAAPQT